MGFGSWCLIESDPGVFFGLFEALGGKGLTFQEVYGLDAATFEAQLSQPPRRQVFGFIFLFNFDKDRGARSADEAAQQLDLVDPLSPEAPFFARQVNAFSSLAGTDRLRLRAKSDCDWPSVRAHCLRRQCKMRAPVKRCFPS